MSTNLSNLAQLFDEGDTTYEDISSSYPDYLEIVKGQSSMTKGPTSNLNITNSPILSVKRFHSKMSSGGGDQPMSKSILKNKSDSSTNFQHNRQRSGTGANGKKGRQKNMTGISELSKLSKQTSEIAPISVNNSNDAVRPGKL